MSGDSPTAQVRRPKDDGWRVRFLTPTEASHLLAALGERSQDAHDFALLSLFTGLRAGECSALAWTDIDFENGLIFVKDTKKHLNRRAFMTTEVKAMLTERRRRNPEAERVFYGRNGDCLSRATGIPFRETVKALGFNGGITDPRQMVCFHTLRHTFASWLLMKGKPLYTVSKLMGHRHPPITERYAHLAPETQKAAATQLERFLADSGNDVILPINGNE